SIISCVRADSAASNVSSVLMPSRYTKSGRARTQLFERRKGRRRDAAAARRFVSRGDLQQRVLVAGLRAEHEGEGQAWRGKPRFLVRGHVLVAHAVRGELEHGIV